MGQDDSLGIVKMSLLLLPQEHSTQNCSVGNTSVTLQSVFSWVCLAGLPVAEWAPSRSEQNAEQI